jgi:hypothetical protein
MSQNQARKILGNHPLVGTQEMTDAIIAALDST